MYHKIEMHISNSEHFLEPNFFKEGNFISKPKKTNLKSIYNCLQNILC